MKIILAAGRIIFFIERTIIVLLLSVMLLLAFTQVILRNYFSSGFLWGDPLLRHMVLWIGFIGASIATHQGKHLNLDVISRFASPRLVNIVRIISSLFPAIVCLFLARAAWTFLLSEKEMGEELFTIGTTSFSTWWFQIIIPAGFGLLTLRFGLKVIEHVMQIFVPRSKKHEMVNIPTPGD